MTEISETWMRLRVERSASGPDRLLQALRQAAADFFGAHPFLLDGPIDVETETLETINGKVVHYVGTAEFIALMEKKPHER